MSAIADIDWTNVVSLDNYGSMWGYTTAEESELEIDEARATGFTIDEWHVADRLGLPIRIVRITDADPEFLDTICVFPAECPDCGSAVTTLAWVSDEHHAKCPHRDPYF
ncbi:hypothetical protein OHA04_45210 (plasmid) [Streptomyces sp. NBC_01590]|uniref:hypothetical protein n=1 Tax=Streptomyces sp. NBC_01590 TaxID=2975887 RepID=UPI0038633B67